MLTLATSCTVIIFVQCCDGGIERGVGGIVLLKHDGYLSVQGVSNRLAGPEAGLYLNPHY